VSDAAGRGPVVLCFDGSQEAANAIAGAGRLLGGRDAVVLTVSEPIELWTPYDPATILDAPLGKLVSDSVGLAEIAEEVALKSVERGVALADAAGFRARGRTARGTAWKEICELAEELDASVIVLGARGRSRIRSALLGSVSATVSVHAERPVLIIHGGGPHHSPTAEREEIDR
jgi:nucleotide-binding universal stress UspA family protein